MQVPPYEPTGFAEALKSVVEGSGTLTEWTVWTIGGTLAVLLSTSYVKPKGAWKGMYLLILPTLVLFGVALVEGFRIRQAQMAFLLRKGTEQAATEALQVINKAIAYQLDFYFYGIVLLGVWLTAYMFWWVFVDTT